MAQAFRVKSNDDIEGWCYSFYTHFDIYWDNGQFQLEIACLQDCCVSKIKEPNKTYAETTICYDKTGRDVREGDLLKIHHFVEFRRRRHIYMYKLICKVNDELKIDKDGKYLYAIGVVDIYRKQDLQESHKCSLSVIDECEIVDSVDCFWERLVNKRSIRKRNIR